MKKFNEFISSHLNETNKYNISEEEYDKLDYLDSQYLRRTVEIANKEPKAGWWVNFSDEYGDVWHKITKIYIDEDNLKYCRVYYWEHRRLNGANEKTTQNVFTYFYKIRDVSENLPEKAHIVFDENGKR
jgi:hypothetical protein